MVPNLVSYKKGLPLDTHYVKYSPTKSLSYQDLPSQGQVTLILLFVEAHQVTDWSKLPLVVVNVVHQMKGKQDHWISLGLTCLCYATPFLLL